MADSDDTATQNGGHMERRMAFEKLEHALYYLLHSPEVLTDALLVIIQAQERVMYGSLGDLRSLTPGPTDCSDC